MRNHYQNRLHRLRQSKNLIFLLCVLFAPELSAQTIVSNIAVPVQGETAYREVVTKKIAQNLNQRVRDAKFKDIAVDVTGQNSLSVTHGKPLDTLSKTLLTSPGKFEIREIVANSDLFSMAQGEFKNVFVNTTGGVRSLCAEARSDLDRVMKRIVGPDVHFGTYRYPKIGWCALALGNAWIGNEAVKGRAFKKSMEGKRVLSIEISRDATDKLTLNGEVATRMFALTLDGDLIARTTLSQLRRLPVSVHAPKQLKGDRATKRWLATVYALIDSRIPVALVLLPK